MKTTKIENTQKIVTLLKECTKALENSSYLRHLLDDEKPITTFIIRDELPIEYKKIEIILLCEIGKTYNDHLLSILVLYTYRTNEKKLLEVDKSKLQYKVLYDLLIATENIFRQSAFHLPGVMAYKKEQWNNLEIYDKYNKVGQNYTSIRNAIADQVLNSITDQSSFNVFLLDINTGLGDCLDVTYRAFERSPNHQKFFVKAFGIDNNEENIFFAQQKFFKTPYLFKIFNTTQIEDFIETNKQQNDFVVVVGSGALTRLVLNNTLEALSVLQQAYRQANVLVLGGETDVLITEKMVKRVGWYAHVTSSTSKHPIYTLRKDSTVKSKIKNNIINLSLHANPLEVLRQYNANILSTIHGIDLGIAYLKDDELTQILTMLPNLKEVFCCGQESWVIKLKQNQRVTSGQLILKEDLAAYIYDERNNEESRELKRNSTKYLQTYFPFFEPPKCTKSLSDNIKRNPQKYNLFSDIIEKSETKEEINRCIGILKTYVDEGDDTAIYYLATQLQQGFAYYTMLPNNPYPRWDHYEDLKSSLSYWRMLEKKNYRASYEILMLEKRIEAKKNSFDVFREASEKQNQQHQNINSNDNHSNGEIEMELPDSNFVNSYLEYS